MGDSGFAEGINTSIATEAQSGFMVANATGESFEESSIAEDSESGTLVTGSQFKEAPKSSLRSVYDFLRKGQRAIFGEDSGFNSIFTILVTLIGTISVLYIWKTWKGGNPD
jgi:hypothetical protein